MTWRQQRSVATACFSPAPGKPEIVAANIITSASLGRPPTCIMDRRIIYTVSPLSIQTKAFFSTGLKRDAE